MQKQCYSIVFLCSNQVKPFPEQQPDSYLYLTNVDLIPTAHVAVDVVCVY